MTESLFAQRRSPLVWWVCGVVLVLALVALAVWRYNTSPLNGVLSTTAGGVGQNSPIATPTYTCDGGKTIQAAYYQSALPEDTPATSSMPTPTGSVALVLSDGRTMTLPQTLSASGIRYANQDESFIFWSKGNTAFVEEGADQKQTYSNCVTAEE